jgi:hypothetical protein
MTREQILRIWPNATESTIRRNLDTPVCAVASSGGKQAALRPLDKGIQKRQKGKGSVVVVVTLITCRRRELDDDGNVAALKPLRDAIASTIGLDDADKRIRFEYGQIESRSKEGVIVKIELLPNLRVA